jgi:hypothetical protein
MVVVIIVVVVCIVVVVYVIAVVVASGVLVAAVVVGVGVVVVVFVVGGVVGVVVVGTPPACGNSFPYTGIPQYTGMGYPDLWECVGMYGGTPRVGWPTTSECIPKQCGTSGYRNAGPYMRVPQYMGMHPHFLWHPQHVSHMLGVPQCIGIHFQVLGHPSMWGRSPIYWRYFNT